MSLETFWSYLPSLLSGFGVTIFCWGVGAVIGLALGFVIALLARLPFPPLAWLLRAFVEVIAARPF